VSSAAVLRSARGWGRDVVRPVTPLRGRAKKSWVLDAGLAGLIALVSVGQPNPRQLAIALVVAALLLFRRIWPVPVNLIVLVIGVVTIGGHSLGLLIGGAVLAVHTLAVLCSLRAAVTGVLIAQLWIAVLAIHLEVKATDRLFILISFSAPSVLAFVLGLYRRARDGYQAELQERNRHLEVEREQRDLLAAADERSRIAREMHDLIAHHLTVVVALSEGLARSGEITSPRSREAVTTTVSMARQALEETRRLLGADPGEGSLGRHPAPDLRSLEGLVSQVRATGLPVTYAVQGTPPTGTALSSGLQLTVYRLVQEALTNAMKHGREITTALVSLRYGSDAIEVSIEDDGQVQTGPASDGRGRGIMGMRERVQSFGGTLAAGPGAGGGWKVIAGFPVSTGFSPSAGRAQ
jgi:signal transduction histidine kinase